MTTLALHLGYGHIAAPATIEGEPVEIIVGTGASRTSVTPGAMIALKLAPDTHRRLTVHGVQSAPAAP